MRLLSPKNKKRDYVNYVDHISNLVNINKYQVDQF